AKRLVGADAVERVVGGRLRGRRRCERRCQRSTAADRERIAQRLAAIFGNLSVVGLGHPCLLPRLGESLASASGGGNSTHAAIAGMALAFIWRIWRRNPEYCLPTSSRGATRRSNPSFPALRRGLLRGACHRGAVGSQRRSTVVTPAARSSISPGS